MRAISRIILVLIIGGLISLAVLYIKRTREAAGEILVEYVDSVPDEPIIVREYGLAVDSFEIVSGRVGRNQTLSNLLNSLGVSNDTVYRLTLASQGVFDLRKIRMGNPYKVFYSRDSIHRLCYLVYEHTPVDYVRFSLEDSIRVTRQEKPVHLETKEASGVITSSLWNTMLDNSLDPMLAFDLSEIYAWSIDFFGLQEGDGFRVLYDEQYVDSNYVGLGKIRGAVFYHAGEDFYAVPFVQDSVESYFDQEGNSLRKAFLKAPLRYSRISSRYSHSRMHPILRVRRPHLGVDYAAAIGTPVHTVGDGRIIKTGYTKGNGNWIKIQHNSVYATAYLHLSHYARGIRTGTYVKQGDVIGYVGATGLATGPHLDFRFYKNGYPVDPLKVEAPPVEPVKPENRVVYDSLLWLTMEKLNRITPLDSSGTGAGVPSYAKASR